VEQVVQRRSLVAVGAVDSNVSPEAHSVRAEQTVWFLMVHAWEMYSPSAQFSQGVHARSLVYVGGTVWT